MLPFKIYGDRGPLVVMLHWLGGSANTWTEVSEGLAARGMMCAAFDLPGFGNATDVLVTDIESSVEGIITTIESLRVTHDGPWFLAGHSMGGKFAAIVARAACDGRQGLEDLCGLLLLSPSPPGPEPMAEDTRRKMLRSLGRSSGDEAEDRSRADAFVDDNTGKLPLLDAVRMRTVDDVLRMNRDAFATWLNEGSKEEWSERVGTILLPTLIMAGTEEPALAPSAQAEHTLPHFSNGTVVSLEGGGHLSPLERPGEVVERFLVFVQATAVRVDRINNALSAEFRELIDSERTSEQTRIVLNQRLSDDGLDAPNALSSEEFITLHALADRVVPNCPFDLAQRVQRWLALPLHDGWRHDTLPPDVTAWRTGLRSLTVAAMREYHVPFVALDGERQDELISKAHDGGFGRGALGTLHIGDATELFSAEQTNAWLGDACAEMIKIYVADPRTMQRIGFTGFADEEGFTQVRLGERESFEI